MNLVRSALAVIQREPVRAVTLVLAGLAVFGLHSFTDAQTAFVLGAVAFLFGGGEVARAAVTPAPKVAELEAELEIARTIARGDAGL